MNVLLTAVAVVLAVVIACLVTWEVLHRRSPLPAAWSPPTFPGRVTGGLGMLVGGEPHDRLRPDEPETILLLHGLGGTADYFGSLYEGLAGEHRLVAVDLLGFGRSIDAGRTDHSLDAHLDAIDGALASIGAGADRVFVAAFSMGSAVALAWAARHPDRTLGVALWGPPVYPATMTDDEIIAESGALTKLVWSDRPSARRVVDSIARHRWAAGWLMAGLAPRFPVPVARWASHHTRAGYRGALRAAVLDAPWRELFGDAADAGVAVTVFRGSDDPVGRREALVAVARRAELRDIEGARHHVAITHPHLLFEHLGS